MLRFRDFLLLEYNEDKNWANHGPKITERLKSQGVNSGHREFWHKQIEDHDPTPNKVYAGWISQKYASGGIRHHEDVGSRVGPALETYHKHKLKKTLEAHGVPKDIGAIKNITHLEDSVDKLPSLHKDDDSKVDDSEVTKHDEEHWKVYTPHTKEASKKYGAGTRWCTAAHNNNMFKTYNDSGPLHIYVPKKPKYPGEKYQGHRETMSFMNEKDEPVNEDEVFKDRPSPHEQKHGVTPECIDKALTHRDYPNRVDAMRHPRVTTEHITKAMKDRDWYVRAIAIQNPKATTEHITKALGDVDVSVRSHAIQHPKVTQKHITKALSDVDYRVRRYAIQNPNLTPEHITKALSDYDNVVVRHALRHDNVTPEHIDKGLKHNDGDVRYLAMNHPNATAENIKTGLSSKDPDVKYLAKTKALYMSLKT